jgi:hypothetical protein
MKNIKNIIIEELSSILESKKWMQKASKNMEKKGTKGGLHKDLGIPEDKEIPASLINNKIATLKKKETKDGKLSDKDLKLMRRLNFAKNAKKRKK